MASSSLDPSERKTTECHAYRPTMRQTRDKVTIPLMGTVTAHGFKLTPGQARFAREHDVRVGM